MSYPVADHVRFEPPLFVPLVASTLHEAQLEAREIAQGNDRHWKDTRELPCADQPFLLCQQSSPRHTGAPWTEHMVCPAATKVRSMSGFR
jgi:hypothetical protein